MIKKLFLLIWFIFIMAQSFTLQKIFIFHINGVNTTQAAAEQNRIQLNAVINIQPNMIANNGQIDLLYNKEDGASHCSLCDQLG